MLKYLLLILFTFTLTADGALAGGRPNAFSEGLNAFAGVVNPANAVWVADRVDVGAFLVQQKSSLNNRENTPLFPPGKIDLTYHSKSLFTVDAAIHKHVTLKFGEKTYDSSLSLAFYTLPAFAKLRTKEPLIAVGTTPLRALSKTDAISLVFSLKLNSSHAVGVSVDYFFLSHSRSGFQNSDNPLRSVSPGHVTNNGTDHSSGIGLSIGWRWKITERLDFGTAWSRKSGCGQFRKYRGYEPHHAKNYVPQIFGAGFSYRFTSRFGGRLELLWTNLGNLPQSNNNILPDGSLNLNKRGSNRSPGPGAQDATYINIGIGYKWNEGLSFGAGFSHRIKLPRKSPLIISHSYSLQTIYDALSVAANFNYEKHDLFLAISYGFKNRVTGLMPVEIGGGKFSGEKRNISLSLSWGYLY